MSAPDLIRLLRKQGWYQVRQTGSHKIFKHDGRPGTIVVPDHGSKDIPTGTLSSILKKAGLK